LVRGCRHRSDRRDGGRGELGHGLAADSDLQRCRRSVERGG
jgi:hypothetical protein